MPKYELKEVFSRQAEVIDLGKITDVDFSVLVIVDTESEEPKAVCRVSVGPTRELVNQAVFTYLDRIKTSLVRRLSRRLGEKVLVGVNETKFGHHALGFFAEGPIEDFVRYFARQEQEVTNDIDIASITFSKDPNAHLV